MNMKEKINVTVRGYKTINELIPGYILFFAVKGIFEALLPFISIYMSGKIITAIAEKRNFQEITVLVLITVILNLIVALIINLMARISNLKSSAFWTVVDLPLDRKIQIMDYEYIENSEIHAKRANIELKRLTMRY